MTFETARYADGPAVVRWLDERGVEPWSESLRKRVAKWRKGSVADIYALDSILVATKYGLWELPDEVWLEHQSPKQIALAGARQKKPSYQPCSPYPVLCDPEWLRAAYESGAGLDAVAAQVGCHRSSVERAMRRYGIKRRAAHRPKVAA